MNLKTVSSLSFARKSVSEVGYVIIRATKPESREQRVVRAPYCAAKLTSMTQNELQLRWWQIRRLIVFVVISRFSLIYSGTLKLLG